MRCRPPDTDSDRVNCECSCQGTAGVRATRALFGEGKTDSSEDAKGSEGAPRPGIPPTRAFPRTEAAREDTRWTSQMTADGVMDLGVAGGSKEHGRTGTNVLASRCRLPSRACPCA